MYPAVLLMYFISAVVIILASLALIVQVSLPYNRFLFIITVATHSTCFVPYTCAKNEILLHFIPSALLHVDNRISDEGKVFDQL